LAANFYFPKFGKEGEEEKESRRTSLPSTFENFFLAPLTLRKNKLKRFALGKFFGRV
jgi:hypothetical protein